MASHFEDIPNEIFESIAVHLDFSELCCLRLCSRSLAAKATQNHFKSFYQVKSASLTEDALASLIQATRPNELGCCVQELTLVGIAINVKGLESLLRKKTKTITERNGPMFMSTEQPCDETELVKAQDDLSTLRQRQVSHEECMESGRYVDLLAELFDNIKTNTSSGSLRKLTLEVAVLRGDAQTRHLPITGGGWKFIWRSATETFQLVMAALARSKLEIRGLHIFSGANMRRCSIARDELSKVVFDQLRTSLTTVRSLAVSLSDRVIIETDLDAIRTGDPGDEIDWSVAPVQRDLHDLQVEASEENKFVGLANLVSSCPEVEELQVHSYSLSHRALQVSDFHHQWLFQRLVNRTSGQLQNLRILKLRNMHMLEPDLLSLVKQSPIGDLSIENSFLMEGTYRELFDYCTGEEAGMTRLFFDDLWEQKHLYFAESGRPKFPSIGGVTGTNTLNREGDAVRKRIKYHFSNGRPLGSPQQYNWHERRRAEYGPP